MCVIPHQISLFLVVHAEHIGDKPSGIYVVPVEPGDFKVPVRNLENVEFDVIHFNKTEISIFHFHDEQGSHIRLIFFLKIIIEVPRFPEGLVQVHKVKFMAHRMDEVFEVGRVVEMGKP